MKPINQEAACRRENMLFETNGDQDKKRGYGMNHNLLILLVGTIGFEPTTSTVSE